MRIHILGICGTFMAGIAVLAKQLGHNVSGSDQHVYPPMSDQLIAQGIQLTSDFEIDQLTPAPDLVIIGNAMKRGNPCVEWVLNQQILYTSGPEWLYDAILKDKWVLAVAGTHGKTTTSSLLAHILEISGLNPGFLIGGVPENFGVSARLTDSAFFVIEADEYDCAFFDKRSKFLHYRPRTTIVNNLEFDHADIFDHLSDIQKQFHYLVRAMPSTGLLICPTNDSALDEVLNKECFTPIQRFGIDQTADWQATALSTDGCQFTLIHNHAPIGTASSVLMGRHNINNALAAIAAAHHVGVPTTLALNALSTFKNVKRRMEIVGLVNAITIYDDFAHHPTAIKTTLEGLRAKVGAAKILAVLECASNTMRMGIHEQTLAASLAAADQAFVLTPSSANWDFRASFQQSPVSVKLADTIEALVQVVMQATKAGDHILIMSNGDFGGFHQKLTLALRALNA